MFIKRLNLFTVFLLVQYCVSASWFNSSSKTGKVNQLWQKVHQAEANKLPKSALKHIEEILEITKAKDELKGHYLKALCWQALNEAHILGKKPVDKLKILREKIDELPENQRPVAKAVVAVWYWHYYQQNTWKFSKRSQTSGLDEEDITTWDSPKLFRKVASLFNEAIRDEDVLKKLHLQDYIPVIQKGSFDWKYCESLYEFLLRQKIDFHTNGINALPKPTNAFEVSSQSDAFADLNSFLNFKPNTTDEDSQLFNLIKSYQSLLGFLREQERWEALVATDIERLEAMRQHGYGSDKNKILIKQYEFIAEHFKDYSESTVALYKIANIHYEEKNFVSAMSSCEQAINRFRSSHGANLCRNLRDRILLPEYKIEIEHSINDSNRKLHLSFKNIKKLYFRVYGVDWHELLEQKYGSLRDSLSKNEYMRLLSSNPLKEWEVDLKPSQEYKSINQTIGLPELDRGYYRVLVSGSPNFDERSNNQLQHAAFWVSDSVVLMRNLGSTIDGMIIDARDGKPVVGAEIQVYKRNRDGFFIENIQLRSNEDGQFRHKRSRRNDYGNFAYFISSSRTGDVLWHRAMGYGGESNRRNRQSVTLFTDRSIYRPGHIVRFKGIAHQSFMQRDDYRVMNDRKISIELRDANYQQVATQVFTPNEFGSFSGQFTLPSNVLTGRMTLKAKSPSGRAYIRVEEYKRPKFEVKLNKPLTQYRLDDTVVIKGEAKTYSGISVANSKVKYRVLRSTRMPWWWRWGNPHAGSREIAFGELKTDDKGSFSIEFVAEPDRQVAPETKPTFNYEVQVDVVDQTGETRSGSESVRLGYVSLDALIGVPEWLSANKPFTVSLSTKTLDGEPTEVKGLLKIIKLKQPQKPSRKPSKQQYSWWHHQNTSEHQDLSDYRNWESGKELNSHSVITESGTIEITEKLPAGPYRAVFTTKDNFDNDIEVKTEFIVFDPSSSQFETKVPSFFKVQDSAINVGESLSAMWASGYPMAQAFFSITKEHKVIKQYWTSPNSNIHFLEFPVDASLNGGFTLQVYFVHENQIYEYKQFINVLRPEKQLKISWGTFRKILRPGQKETWTMQIKGHNAELIASEMVATLYDASLDSFIPHKFKDLSSHFYKSGKTQIFDKNIYLKYLQNYFSGYRIGSYPSSRTYPSFQSEIRHGLNYFFPQPARMMMFKSFGAESMRMPPDEEGMDMRNGVMSLARAKTGRVAKRSKSKVAPVTPNESKGSSANKKEFKARTNLNETAFFFPHLQSDEEGTVKLEFEMPEALTRWKFLAMAHGIGMESGLFGDNVLTQKELMVEPNAPRFLRQGDSLTLTAKVSSLAVQEIQGKARLRLFNALTDEDVTKQILMSSAELDFNLKKGASTTAKWQLNIPQINYPIRYRVMAESQSFSDGEENILPVLSNRILVRENKSLWVRGNESRDFQFEKLVKSYQSSTLKHEKLVFQMTSNPSWYAVLALPYLAEYPYECSEQIFNRLYANQLGLKIIHDNPRIERVFQQWRGTETLKSPLQKNQDLKAVLLAETPWVTEAKNEQKARQNLGIFFDRNRLNLEFSNALDKLAQRQLSNGAFSWFPGGRANEFITLYLVTGFGRLRHLGVDMDMSLATKALNYLDGWMNQQYLEAQKYHPEKNHFSSSMALYLYGRSFFIKEARIANQVALDYWMTQATKYWTKLNSRMNEAHVALGMHRLGDKRLTNDILKSLRERALHSEEMGMYWGDQEFSYWWYRAPIETQAMMIELFSEFAEDDKEVDDLKVWLIKQKQTQDWKTTKATSDAVYSLLLKGGDWLSSTELVEVKLGDQIIRPEKVEAGTGFYEKRFTPAQIKAELGNIKITKKDKGVAWGGLFWQYFEDIDKITHHGGPLNLDKKLFIRKNTKAGPVIEPYENNPLEVGDTLVVRIILRADRDFEYVHLKDMRGAGTEPVNVLSSYKYQDGLAYYESTKDTATHFFIDYLPKGTYVFEYDLKIFHRGKYQSGMAEIECMYAPEFNAHSKSYTLDVR